jgi:hypothetical protein
MTSHTRRSRSGEMLETLTSEEHRSLTMMVGMATGDQKQARRSDAPQDTSEARPASNIKNAAKR